MLGLLRAHSSQLIPQMIQKKGHTFLDANRKLRYKYLDLRYYEVGRENPVPAGSGGVSPGLRSPNDATGVGAGDSRGFRSRQLDQPVLSLADRERHTSAYDAVVTGAASQILQGASRVSGGRSGGLSHGADFRFAYDGRAARCLAVARFRALCQRSGSQPGSDQGCARERHSPLLSAAG